MENVATANDRPLPTVPPLIGDSGCLATECTPAEKRNLFVLKLAPENDNKNRI